MKIQSKTTIVLPWRKPSYFLFFILQLVACSLWGQVLQKKVLTAVDYPKWGQLDPNKISPSGQWVSYAIAYESGLDTLFIKNTKSLKTHTFPLGNNGDFITSEWFVFQTAEGLHLMNLKTGKQETVPNASQYVYSTITKKLMILVTEKEKRKALIIREPQGTIQERIVGVDEFIIDPTNRMILYTIIMDNKQSICLLDLSKKNTKITLLEGANTFNNLVWHIKGKALAFMQESNDVTNPDNTIFYYTLSNKKLYKTNRDTQHGFLSDSLFVTATNHKLKISDDMQKVFFTLKRMTKSKDSIKGSDVQLWNGNAKWIFPMEEMRKSFKEVYLGSWQPLENNYRLISDDNLPQFMLTGDQNFAILSNAQQYEPQYAFEGPQDYYIEDLSTGKRELLLKKHNGYNRYLIPSPNGKYIAYFQKKNWWVYDIIKKTHTNITKNIEYPFFHNKKEHPQNISAFSNLGWTPQDKEILLCDAYDIWAIDPGGLSTKRLTHGREIKTEFQLAGYDNVPIEKTNYNGNIHDVIDLSQGLLLEGTNEQGYFGYYKWSFLSNKNLVLTKNGRLAHLVRSESGNMFMYTEERYDLSPRLMLVDDNQKESKLLVQSNLQQQHFYWGKAELIQYKNKKGESLQGVLYYPADYTNEKKYPMIVYIYEKLSKDLHNYINPSEFTGDGLFNISTFTTQGYFVLAPDISYKIGDPGISATDCVVSSTNEVIARGLVLPNKIGLIGHSFGGYQANFIITQTNLFAAAVAGSAASDLTSFYLTVGWNNGRPDMWRFENQQWRMGKSLFEDRIGYDRNSPIAHVENITTPLLSWTGGNDLQINWSQSIEFYLALRRLEKKHIMFLYPNEGHNLTNKKNQKDLSIRLHEWFDYHLKDIKTVSWIKTGLQ